MDIINYTRYSTEDLQRIVRFIEARQGFATWRTDRLVFQEFDPKNPFITDRRRWRNTTGEKVKRYVSKMRWVAMDSISLLVPSKIYENPLEALVQDDAALAPADMLVQIGNSLLDRCNIGSYNSKLTGGDLPSLRVLDRPETKKPKADPKKVEGARREYIKRNLRGFAWDTRRAVREMSKGYNKQIKAAAHHLKAEKGRLASIDSAFSDAITALAHLEAIINTTESGV